jgi:hypothetical protein
MRVARVLAIALAAWGALLSYLLFTGRVPAAWLQRTVPASAPVAHEEAAHAKDELAEEAEPAQAAPAEAAPAASPALSAARFAVCAREEAPPLLSRVRVSKDAAALWALHCGPSVHVLSIEREADTLIARRVLRARVPARSPAEAPRPALVRAGDVDGDGRSDLIVPALFADRTNAPAAGTLALLRQRAEGGFDAPRRLFDGAIGDVTAAALDAQPGQDLALLHLLDARNARESELWLVHGGPSPLRYAQMPAGVGASALCAADLDADGLDDVVAASEREQRVRIWLSSHGEATRAEPIAIESPGVRELIAGDVDGDGKNDVVLNGASVSLLLAGKDFRAEPIAIADSAGLRDVQLEDIDGDGKLDVVGYAHPNLIALRQGTGLAFTRSTLATLRGDFGVLYARAARLDDDSRPDLVLILLSNGADAAIEVAVARDLHDGLAVEPASHVEPARDAALAEHFDLP